MRVNERFIASAAVQNVGGADGSCSYRGRAVTHLMGNDKVVHHAIAIDGHDRNEIVWALIKKIAEALSKEES